MKFSSIILTLAGISMAQGSFVERRAGSKMTQAAAAKKLSAAGITASSTGGCTDKSKGTCTSYDGLRTGTVDSAITLKEACACSLIITGGTEVGHASSSEYSHSNGYKLDFRKNDKLTSYIKNSYSKMSDRSDGAARYKSAAGNIYADEGSHWDVVYY